MPEYGPCPICGQKVALVRDKGVVSYVPVDHALLAGAIRTALTVLRNAAHTAGSVERRDAFDEALGIVDTAEQEL